MKTFSLLFLLVLSTSHLFPSIEAIQNLRQSRILQKQQDFIDACTARLLSDDTVADELISQDEFALLISDYCIEQGVCEPGSTLEFQNLSVEMQLAFVLFLCDEPTEIEQQRCLEELKATGGPFGYDLKIEEREVLDAELSELCSRAYEQAAQSGLLAPTVAPSIAPPPPPSSVNVPTEDGGNSPTDGNDGGNSPTDGNDGENNADPGASMPGENGSGAVVNSRTVSNGLIAGVAIAGVVVLLVAGFLVSRRRARRRTKDAGNKYQGAKYVQDVDIEGDESIFTEDSAALKYIPSKLDSFYSSRSVGSSSQKSSKHSTHSGSSGEQQLPPHVVALKSKSVAQFDPSNAAAAIALDIDGQYTRRGSGASSQKSSPAMSLDSEKHGKMSNLTAAIERGDWDAVAKLASVMDENESEEGSSLSDYSSAREQLSLRSSVSSLNSGDSIRAAQIEELVARSDWSGVAAAAQFFSSTKSLASNERGGESGTSAPESPKRSFLDFVTGRRSAPSAAASAAIVSNAPDLVDRDSEFSEAGAIVGPPDDVPSILDVGHSNTMDTQSSSSRGSRQDSSSPEKPKRQSRRWFGRFSRSTKEGKSRESENTDTASIPVNNSSALQADLAAALDRGDWAAIEEISASLDVSGTRGVSLSQRVARGNKSYDAEDSTLGASSLSSLKKKSSSIASQRAEIDEAVARGDWDEVERLTTQLLNTKPSPVVVKEMMADTLLMNRTPSSMNTSPVKSPFRDTPSSSEWSQSSPMEKEVRTEKLRKLIAAKDWKGVHVLSGIYEMENKGTLPPTFSSMSGDSAEQHAEFAMGWLSGGNDNHTPPQSVEGTPKRGRPPPSPSTSTSTNNSNEIREFERLVNAQDWKGLAYFAGAEEDLDQDSDGEALIPQNLFDIDPLAPKNESQAFSSDAGTAKELNEVHLREKDGTQQKVAKRDADDSDVESIHGTEKLIPHWQELVDKNMPFNKGKK